MSGPVVVHQEVITQLRQAMHDRGMRQSELAEQMGHSGAWLSRVLSGDRELKVRDAEKMARILGVEIRIELGGQP